MANDRIQPDSGESVDESMAILGGGKADKTREAMYEESLTEDLGYADYRPDAQYLLSEARSARASTAAQRAVEYRRQQEVANDSFDQTTTEEAEKFEDSDK